MFICLWKYMVVSKSNQCCTGIFIPLCFCIGNSHDTPTPFTSGWPNIVLEANVLSVSVWFTIWFPVFRKRVRLINVFLVTYLLLVECMNWVGGKSLMRPYVLMKPFKRKFLIIADCKFNLFQVYNTVLYLWKCSCLGHMTLKTLVSNKNASWNWTHDQLVASKNA